MEGLKLIAQSTFDRHQKFRPNPGSSSSEGPYRYNVIEIGAFGSPAASKRQSVGSASSGGGGGIAGSRNGGIPGTGPISRVTLNEWMVFEDDLNAFMKKRPVDYVPPSGNSALSSASERLKSATQSAGSAATGSTTTYSRSFSVPSSQSQAATSVTTATSGSSGASASRREEVEAVASLKLVCLQRIEPDDMDDVDPDMNTLAISRDTFLRLYVNQMDADHCALYYLAREYDGFHEFNDSSKGIATKYLGTSDYALIWTFNRRTLETRGLFIDRCQRWQMKDSSPKPAPAPAPRAPSSDPGERRNSDSPPVTPVRKMALREVSSVHSTPSKRWTKNKSGSVTASEAWQGFKDTLNVYRGYIFAAQLLSFVCCVHMLRSFDDEVTDGDLPLLNSVEANLGAGGPEDCSKPDAQEGRRMVNGTISTQQTSSFALVPEPNPFRPSTPPGDSDQKPTHHHDEHAGGETASETREKLMSQALTIRRVDTSLANKLRHLKMANRIFEVMVQDHETVIVDVVAPQFLDRYHWAMEGMNEAIPALERHMASLDEYLRFLKGRSERLSGLVRSNSLLLISTTTTTNTHNHHHHHHTTNSSSRSTQSDALSLRCNEADSRSSDVGRPFPRPAGGGGFGRGRIVDAAAAVDAIAAQSLNDGGDNNNIKTNDNGHDDATHVNDGGGGGRGRGTKESSGAGQRGGWFARSSSQQELSQPQLELQQQLEQQQQQQSPRGRNLGFYAGYLLRGNYSHRLT